jgi:hypothetical protein
MRKLFKRWYVWLGLVLLLGLAGSVVLIYASRSRSGITQANFDRIQRKMSVMEVVELVGKPTAEVPARDGAMAGCYWRDGPDYFTVWFNHEKVEVKTGHFATAWETLQWYAKKGAEKIGVKWD